MFTHFDEKCSNKIRLISVTIRRLNVKLVTLVADVLGGTSRQDVAHKRSLYSATELAASCVSALKSSLRANKNTVHWTKASVSWCLFMGTEVCMKMILFLYQVDIINARLM